MIGEGFGFRAAGKHSSSGLGIKTAKKGHERRSANVAFDANFDAKQDTRLGDYQRGLGRDLV